MIGKLIFIVPVILTMLWVLYTKLKQHKVVDFIILFVAVSAVVVNVCFVEEMIEGDISVGEHVAQMAVCSMIVPLLYQYFARQVGRQVPNTNTIIALWVIAAFTFVPGVVFYNPFEETVYNDTPLQPFALYVISGGKKAFAIYTGDLVVMLQGAVTVVRIANLIYTLHQHNLRFNGRVYAFLSCWVLCVIFIFMISTMSYEELRTPLGQLFCYSGYTVNSIFMNVLIAKGYDLFPIETVEGVVVDDVEVYVRQQYRDKASELRRMMEQEEMYLDPQITADRVITLLGTNHTYFSQMMSSEWRMSFSEYLNALRLARVEKLLEDESMTIAAVAAESGFANAGYMSRKFKEKYGATPSEWRKML